MNESIIFKTSELIEYSSLINRMAFDPKMETTFSLKEVYYTIRDRTDACMSGLLKTDMAYFGTQLVASTFVNEYAVFQHVENVPEFLEILNNSSANELLEAYYWSIIERKPTDDPKLIEQELKDDDFLLSIDFDYNIFVEFVEMFDQMKQRFILFFETFYKKVFLPNRDLIMAAAEEGRIEYESLYRKDPVSFIHQYIKINADSLIKDPKYKAYFYCNVTHPITMSFTMRKDTPEVLYIVFGVHVGVRLNGAIAEDMIKTLSEPTKMAIIKLLVTKNMYASELATALELNRATISHHLHQLVKFDIVNLSYSEGNKSYYTVNIAQIKKGFSDFITLLENMEKSN